MIVVRLSLIALIVAVFIVDIKANQFRFKALASVFLFLLWCAFKLPCGYGDKPGTIFYVIMAVLSAGVSLFYNFFGTKDKKEKIKQILFCFVGFAVLFFIAASSAFRYVNLNYKAETVTCQAEIVETHTKKYTHGKNKSTTDYYCIMNDTGEQFYFSLRQLENQEFEEKTGGKKKEGDTVTYIKGKGCLGIEFFYPDTRVKKDTVKSFFGGHDTVSRRE